MTIRQIASHMDADALQRIITITGYTTHCSAADAAKLADNVRLLRRANCTAGTCAYGYLYRHVIDILLTDAALALEEQVKTQLEKAEEIIRCNLSEREIERLFSLLKKIGRPIR